MNLVRRDEVLEDLINLAYYIAQDSPEAADRFFDATEAAFTQLLSTPYIGAEREFRNAALKGVRMWLVPGFEKHIIFYRVEGDTVEIIRILHASRDIASLFEDQS